MTNSLNQKKIRSAKKMRIIDSVWTHALLAVLAILWLAPIIWIVLRSFSDVPGMATASIWPERFSLVNYRNLFVETWSIKFVNWYRNTLLIAVANCVLSTLVTLGAAYALARFRFKTRKTFISIALILGMFPGFMAIIAIVIILNMLGLFNQPFALLLVYVSGAGLGFFVSKGYFDTLPVSLDEAALIDGASQAVIFFKIILPLSKTIIIYTAMLAFMVPWSDFILAGQLLRLPEYQTVAVGLFHMTGERNISRDFPLFTAGSVLVAVPIVILYLILQRYMIAGISSGAVKG